MHLCIRLKSHCCFYMSHMFSVNALSLLCFRPFRLFSTAAAQCRHLHSKQSFILTYPAARRTATAAVIISPHDWLITALMACNCFYVLSAGCSVKVSAHMCHPLLCNLTVLGIAPVLQGCHYGARQHGAFSSLCSTSSHRNQSDDCYFPMM